MWGTTACRQVNAGTEGNLAKSFLNEKQLTLKQGKRVRTYSRSRITKSDIGLLERSLFKVFGFFSKEGVTVNFFPQENNVLISNRKWWRTCPTKAERNWLRY